MTNKRIIEVKPSKKQFQALQILLEDNWIDNLGYWWAAGWGKTILAALWISMMCKKYPWVKYWVFRRYITDVLDTTFQSFVKALLILWFNEASSIDVLNREPWVYDYVTRNWGKEIVFSNGSEIIFRWLQDKPTDKHFTKIWGLEITWAYIDEANECPEMGVSVLKKRVWRHMNVEYNIPRKVLTTFNPDKWWVYRTFYLPYKNWLDMGKSMFIPALPTDNPYLSKEYLEELKNEPNEVLRQRYYYWNFDYDDTPWRLFEYDKILDLKTNPKYNWVRYISCDVARKGKDKAIIMVFDWYEEIDRAEFWKCLNIDIENKIKEFAYKYNVWMSNVIVDEDWVWGWVVDALSCKWFINNSSAIQPLNTEQVVNFQNLKTQCYFELAKLVNWNKFRMLDDNFTELSEELDVIVEIDLDKDSKKKIINKDGVKEKLWRSPDYSDTLMMRCYFELNKIEPSKPKKIARVKIH